MLEPQPTLRIKLNMRMLVGAIVIGLFAIAILSRKTDPQSSSFACLSALFMSFGMAANFAVPKIQSFLHRRGYQPNSLYGNHSSAIEYADSGTTIEGGISCNFSDGGGCDGGG